jgi:hypothetical protein
MMTEFESSGMNPGEFATMATEKLGIVILYSHVDHRRKELGLKAIEKRSNSEVDLVTRVNDLEITVALLKKQLNKAFGAPF